MSRVPFNISPSWRSLFPTLAPSSPLEVLLEANYIPLELLREGLIPRWMYLRPTITGMIVGGWDTEFGVQEPVY